MADKVSSQDIVGLLAELYGDPQQYAIAAEVSASTGPCHRRIDFMVMHCWRSENFKIEGFEIKVSKSDLKRELVDPSKHNVFFDEIDTYTLVAPDYILDKEQCDLLPPKWGILKVVFTDGKPELKWARKPIALHDEQLSERKLGRNFIASFARAINNQGAAKQRMVKSFEEEREKMRARITEELTGKACHIVPDFEYENLVACSKTCNKLGLSHWGGHVSDYDVRRLKDAVNVVENLHGLSRYLGCVKTESMRAQKTVDALLKEGSMPQNDIIDMAKKLEEANEKVP